ncbi:hypothetical protein [Sulfitobacter sp. MOLA879]|uniref:hypothetical protein n=1 Tax=Sulfitobacter sp. MOLA879 TaxID=3368579 RepID=UPI0037471EC0
MRYIAIAALIAALGLSGALWWQASKVDALQATNAQLRRNVEDLSAQRDQILLSIDLAQKNAARHAETAAALRVQLDAYERGDCDATDPVCAVDYINRILRSREN